MIKNLSQLHEQLSRLSKLILDMHLPEEDRSTRDPPPQSDAEAGASVKKKSRIDA